MKMPLKLLYPGVFSIGKEEILVFGGVTQDETVSKQSYHLRMHDLT